MYTNEVAAGQNTEFERKHILCVTQLLPIPFAYDPSQFRTIFELSDSAKMEVLAGFYGLTT